MDHFSHSRGNNKIVQSPMKTILSIIELSLIIKPSSGLKNPIVESKQCDL